MQNQYGGGCSDNSLNRLLSYAGLTLLLLLFSQNLLRLPFVLVQRVYLLFDSTGIGAALLRLAPYAIYLVSMLLTIVVARYLFGYDSRFVFPMAEVRRDYLAPAVLSTLGVAMLTSLAATFITVILGCAGIYSRQNTPSFDGGAVVVLITLFSSTVLPAIFEELLFRGLLLQPLRRYGDRLAVVASALLFALVHPTLPQALNAFIVGLALGTLAVRSGSLIAPMTVHFIYNTIACVINLLATHYPIVGGIVSWAVIVLLVIAGFVAMAVLRNRFGIVWRLSRDGEPPSGSWYAALTSIPLLAAVLLCVIQIIRNMYYMPIGGWLP